MGGLALNKRAHNSGLMAASAGYRNSLYQFVAGDLAAHCNPVTCVLHGKDRPLVVKHGKERVHGGIVLIRPGVEHRVEIGGAARVLYLNGLDFPSDSQLADVLRGRLEQLAMSALDGDASAQYELRERLSRRQTPCSPAVAEVARAIGADPMLRMTQDELAKRLSMERTRALRAFKAETGMTFRGFKRWVGLQAATRRIAEGDLVRNAAMDGGFSDTAHLTRTFKAFFGITPMAATADRR
jgi:AraC-like DNA-binding protein